MAGNVHSHQYWPPILAHKITTLLHNERKNFFKHQVIKSGTEKHCREAIIFRPTFKSVREFTIPAVCRIGSAAPESSQCIGRHSTLIDLTEVPKKKKTPHWWPLWNRVIGLANNAFCHWQHYLRSRRLGRRLVVIRYRCDDHCECMSRDALNIYYVA